MSAGCGGVAAPKIAMEELFLKTNSYLPTGWRGHVGCAGYESALLKYKQRYSLANKNFFGTSKKEKIMPPFLAPFSFPYVGWDRGRIKKAKREVGFLFSLPSL